MGQKTSDFSAIPLCSGHHRRVRIRTIGWESRDFCTNMGSA